MIDILNRCDELINQLDDCQDIEERQNCPTCMSTSFYNPNMDTYNCLKKLAYYTINYGPIYISEIYHFLNKSKLLETIIEENGDPETLDLNIKSFGCGFAPDDIALNKYRKNNNLNNLNFNYFGSDIEPLWKYITNTNAVPIIHDVLDGISFNNVNIVFLNKIFSTLKNHDLADDFLEKLEDAIINLPEGSYLVFNDINNNKMGRDDFHDFAINTELTLVKKYYFNVEGAYTGDFSAIDDINNICIIPETLTHSPKEVVNKTVIFLYKKEG